MKKLVAAALVAVSALSLAGATSAISADSMMMSMPVYVGGAPMYAKKNIIENAVNSKDHTTLVAAVKAAGLVDALSGPGPFTVFAPTNEAFAALPAGTVDNLLKPANKKMLVKILEAHVAAGHWDAADLLAKAKASGGSFRFKTLSGDYLTAVAKGNRVYIVDENGGVARITIKDVEQSNGVIHVVNKVLLPK